MGLLDDLGLLARHVPGDARNALKGLLGDMPLTKALRGESEVSANGLKNALMGMQVGPDAQGSYDAAMQIGPQAMGGLLGGIYKYSAKYRPPNSTNAPKGFTKIGPADGVHKFGTVSYEKPLTSAQLEQFELTPLDPKHPSNIKKAFEGWREGFVNKFSESGAYEVKNNAGKRVALVTEDMRGDAPFRVTFLDGDAPTGHDTFSDFDELAQTVWGLSK